MAHPERVTFGLSLTSSSSELMNASMISLESYVLLFLSVGWPAIRGLFCCNLCLTVTFALLFAFILRRVSRKQTLVILLIQPRKSALLPEHHERNSSQKLCAIIAKARFTAERSRQFDVLQAKEATVLSVEGCSERASELSMPEYQLKPSGLSKSTEEWWKN